MNPIARIGFLIKGDYSDTEMYDFMDIVYYNGASYVAKKPTIGNAPVRKNEYWQIFAEGGTLTGNSDISDTNVTFEQASDRVNISSKEKLSVIMGKIKKWFTDLKSVAFSGSYEDLSNKPDLKTVATTGNYSDLSNKPTIPTALKNPKALTFTGGVTGSYDGSAAKSVKVPSLTNNLLATAAGTALDAAQGKVLDGKIAQINSNLSGKADKTVTVDINNSSGVYHGETFPFGVKMLTGFKKSANYNLSRAYGNAFYTDFSIALPTFFNNISCAIVQLYSSAGAYVTVTGWSDREITGYIISPENTAINAALQFIIYGT